MQNKVGAKVDNEGEGKSPIIYRAFSDATENIVTKTLIQWQTVKNIASH